MRHLYTWQMVHLAELRHLHASATFLVTALEVLEAEAKESEMNVLAAWGFLVAVLVVA